MGHPLVPPGCERIANVPYRKAKTRAGALLDALQIFTPALQTAMSGISILLVILFGNRLL